MMQAKAKCLEAHGYSLTAAKDTEEGRAYKKAYAAARTVILRHSRYEFEHERATWFARISV